MNNKGSGSIWGFVLGIFIAIVIMIFFGGNIINTFGHQAIVANNITGLPAFLISNLTLIIWIVLIILILFVARFGIMSGSDE